MISHKHRFVFIHIPKTAGTSVRRALGNWSDAFKVKVLGSAYKHMTAEEAKQRFRADAWEKFFKFCFVRNPWDRMVSYYFFHREGGGSKRARQVIEFCQNHSFREFVDEFVNTNISQGPQLPWITLADGTMPMDFVGKIENLDADFAVVCDRIGMRPTRLPRLNPSGHGHYTEYYDDHTRDAIARAHRVDIEYFNYEFGE